MYTISQNVLMWLLALVPSLLLLVINAPGLVNSLKKNLNCKKIKNKINNTNSYFSESDSTKRDIKVYFNIILFCSACIGIVNLSVTLCEMHNLVIASSLSYSEAINLILSFGSAIAIAFFQHRIDKSLRAADEAELELNKKIHMEELRSERFRSIRDLIECIGRGENYHLPESMKLGSNIENRYCVVIECDNSKQTCFYHPYFELRENVNICCKSEDGKRLDISVYECTYHRIKLGIVDDNTVKKFFSYPTLLTGKEKVPKICITLEFKVIDKSINFPDGAQIDINYIVSFEISPKSGYKKDGTFDISVNNVKMELTK